MESRNHFRREYSQYAKLDNMYSTSPRSGGAWFSNCSIIESQLPPPPRIHRFRDPSLEGQVYTPRSSYTGQDYNSNMPADSPLEFLGDSLLKALAADLLNELFPDLGEYDLSQLHESLVSPYICAFAARRLKIDKGLNYDMTEIWLADLFKAYIAGIYRDLGSDKWHVLRSWFKGFFEPLAVQYKSYYDNWNRAQGPQHSHSRTPMSGSRGRMTPYEHGSSSRSSTYMGDPALYYPATPTPPGFESYSYPTHSTPTSNPQRSEATVELKEWADKQHRRPPEYVYESNGGRGDSILWKASVSLNGQHLASAWAKTKKEAQHDASRNALDVLRGKYVPDPM